MMWTYVWLGLVYACISLLALGLALSKKGEREAARAFLLTPVWPLVVLWLIYVCMAYIVRTALERDSSPQRPSKGCGIPEAPSSHRKTWWRGEPPAHLPSTLKDRW